MTNPQPRVIKEDSDYSREIGTICAEIRAMERQLLSLQQEVAEIRKVLTEVVGHLARVEERTAIGVIIATAIATTVGIVVQMVSGLFK